MKHVIAYSGGKDSTALLLWAKEQGLEYTAVFCDTGWEHPFTYKYIESINKRLINGKLIVLKSEKYDGMEGLVQIKGRVPSFRARFCTDNLKVKPMIAWLKEQNDEITVYQGIRADESAGRAKLDIRQWSDDYDAWIERPLLKWTSKDCFDMLRKHGIEPNPLYLLGAGRVGCFPCVLINKRDLKDLARTFPEIWDRIALLETKAGRSFFPPGYIPDRFMTGFDEKSGKHFPNAIDVKKYIENADQGQLFGETPSCMSIYNLCE